MPIIIICLLNSTCDLPYNPKPESAVLTPNQPTDVNNTEVEVLPVVPNMQICNPSISQDTVNFRGCMLWLNFSGELPVKTTSATAGYQTKNAAQHDRLTVIDTSNTVQWYMMKTSIDPSDDPDLQFQDPEWAAHPEYIATLFGSTNYSDKWSFYAVHPLSNDIIKLRDEKLNETSTPHLWVQNTAYHGQVKVKETYDQNGLIDTGSVNQFFGTLNVKMVYSIKENGVLTLYYVDYSTGVPVPKKLQRPGGDTKKSWNFESALISPDGNWVVYNGYESSTYYESYLQELKADSKAILISSEQASDPHWWQNPVNHQLCVIFNKINGDNRVFADLAKPSYFQSGDAGKTYIRTVTLSSGLPSVLTAIFGTPSPFVNLPLKGGLSPDGRFLCTGYNYAYLVRLH
jgi:hypothetical protein